MVARHGGLPVSVADIFDHSRLDPVLGRGGNGPELAAAMKGLGFLPQNMHTQGELASSCEAIAGELKAGRPIIAEVERHENLAYADPRPRAPWVVITGSRDQELVFHDPGHSDGVGRVLPASSLLQAGKQLLYTQKGSLNIRKVEAVHRPFHYSRRIRRLRGEVGKEGLHVTMEEPFVVIGDAPPEQLQKYSHQVIRWAVDLLRRAYFKSDPQEMVEIWLLSDDTTYRKIAETRWGDPPETPYGYYDPAAEVLVMNIATGGGTLVHELVHPFIATNFPLCPKWFDEGLASLYEQSSERDGHIVGLPNWRLPGLQEAITAGTLPTFKTLCHTGRRFYADDPGTNYAQARYLCYWLQEHNLLHSFYHAFVAAAREDPSGYKTLQKTLNTQNMTGFQARWSQWVLKIAE